MNLKLQTEFADIWQTEPGKIVVIKFETAGIQILSDG